MAKRQTVQLDEEMKDVLDRASHQSGMSQVEVVRRLLRFYDRQADLIQYEMLGTLPPSIRERRFVEQVLDSLDRPPAAAIAEAEAAAGQADGDAQQPSRRRRPS